MSNGISGVGGFGTYTIFNSALQYLLGIGRRNNADEQQQINENFELQLVKAKEEFSDEIEAEKIAMTRAKMQLAREYRAIEIQDKLCLSQRRSQLLKFLKEDLPLDPTLIKSLSIEAEKSRSMEAKGLIAPVNVLFMSPIREVDQPMINESFEDYFRELGNVRFLPWTTKLASGNSSILNLNVIMRDMPTLVVSPRYIEAEKKVLFSAALWDSNSERHPYIRPLFKMDFDHSLLLPKEGEKGLDQIGRRKLSEKLIFATTMIVGCARDSYMLMSHGLTPTLPALVSDNEWIRTKLVTPEAEDIRRFIQNEYQSNVKSLLSQGATEKNPELLELTRLAQSSLREIEKNTNNLITE